MRSCTCFPLTFVVMVFFCFLHEVGEAGDNRDDDDDSAPPVLEHLELVEEGGVLGSESAEDEEEEGLLGDEGAEPGKSELVDRDAPPEGDVVVGVVEEREGSASLLKDIDAGGKDWAS
ncbi:hypothetical protein QOT17_009288 [Balamuthia mandrillaris]